MSYFYQKSMCAFFCVFIIKEYIVQKWACGMTVATRYLLVSYGNAKSKGPMGFLSSNGLLHLWRVSAFSPASGYNSL